MSSLLGKLVERAREKVGDEDWVARAVESGRRELDELPVETRYAAEAALEVLERRKADLAHVSQAAFVAVAARVALGQDDEAHVEWVLHDGSFAERIAARETAAGEVIAEEDARREAWARIRSVALEVLRVAGQVAIPLLLAAL